MIKRHHYLPLFTRVFLICVYVVLGSIVSCAKNDDGAIEMLEFRGFPLDTSIVYFKPAEDPILPPMLEPELEGNLTLAPYAEFNTPHQSAAVYGDYAFLVMDGRQGIRLYDMAKGRTVYTLKLKAESTKVYHCNQSTFGVQAYEPADFFPLLYVSQRARSENRCLTEVFRIVPLFNADSTLIAFRTELVQEILFPPMSKENAMGNVNCVIDPKTGWMYTYSRNNVTADDNYALCRISIRKRSSWRMPTSWILSRLVLRQRTCREVASWTTACTSDKAIPMQIMSISMSWTSRNRGSSVGMTCSPEVSTGNRRDVSCMAAT